ncbi:MAG: tape measure protein, partial [Cucumibacter sp.]
MSVIGVSLGIGALVRYADTWSDINARVGLAIGNMDAAGIVMDRLSDVARRTYSALNLTAEGFIRNATVLKELGKSTAEQLDFTESLNLAMV